jgi:hypothetical protein
MVRDEAPAATTRDFNGKPNVTARKSVRLRAGRNFYGAVRPASLLRKSILDLKPAGLCDGWLHCNIQVVCHAVADKISCDIKRLNQSFGTLREDAATNFEQAA